MKKSFLASMCLVSVALVAGAADNPNLASAPPPAQPPPLSPAPISPPPVSAPPHGAASSSAANAAKAQAPQPYDLYYGVYANGHKVGWMHSRLSLRPQPVLSTEMHAQIAGMGQVSQIELNEERVYAVPGGAGGGSLERLSFSQRTGTGTVSVHGARLPDGQMELRVRAGGEEQRQKLEVGEHLSDALAAITLAREGRVGATLQAVHLDPSLQRLVRVEYRALSLQRRNLAGVDTQAIKVASSYPDLKVSEVAWLDRAGKVLESQMGDSFVVRLEPQEVAKRLDYAQDLLISAVVRAPRVLVAPQSIGRLALRLRGFGDSPPPTSSRQAVSVAGDDVHVVMVKDALPRRTPLQRNAHPTSPEVQAALQATPFIQSNSPEIVAAARRAAGSASDIFTASTRLVSWVHRTMHSEYVPAYSNALEALHSGRGDCTEYSILFVALARALKIPARVAVGIAYWPPGDGFGWHAWAEVYMDGRWLAVDPTWDQPIADATHLKLADGGAAEQARIVMLLGRLKIVEMQTD